MQTNELMVAYTFVRNAFGIGFTIGYLLCSNAVYVLILHTLNLIFYGIGFVWNSNWIKIQIEFYFGILLFVWLFNLSDCEFCVSVVDGAGFVTRWKKYACNFVMNFTYVITAFGIGFLILVDIDMMRCDMTCWLNEIELNCEYREFLFLLANNLDLDFKSDDVFMASNLYLWFSTALCELNESNWRL